MRGVRQQGDVALSVGFRHSGIEHMAAALARVGRLQALYVPHDANTMLRLARRVTGRSSRLTALVAKRAYAPRGTSVALMAGVRLGGAYRLGIGHGRPRMEAGERLDAAVARRIARQPPAAFVGMPFTSRQSFEAAKVAGAVTFLNVNALTWVITAALQRELNEAPSPELRGEVPASIATLRPVARLEAELALADVVFAQSRFAAGVLVAHGVADDRLVMLPSGVDPERFQPTTRDSAARPLRVLFVGWVGYRKGLRFLAEAAAAAPDAVASVTAVGGSWAEVSALRRSMPHVRFAGEVPPAAVAAHYAAADVLVLPSLAESMARVVLEAMACGLPVVVTPECGYGGVVDDGVHGFVVPVRDAGAIADRLRTLARSGDLRARMGAAARSRALEYTWDRFEATFLQTIDRLCPGSGHEPGS